MTDNRVRIFVSSPSDLDRERALIKEIVEQLGQEYLPYFRLQPVLWEEEALTAAQSFQAGLARPSECDIVLVMLWTRLGTPLADDPYGGMTGTEWEFVDAVEASARDGRPQVLVYKKTTPRLVDVTNAQATREAVQDRERLDAFFTRHFFNPDGSFRRAFRQFESDQRLRALVEGQLRKLLNRLVSAERGAVADRASWGLSPFRPDLPFGQADQAVFVGREAETRELVAKLEASRGRDRGLVLVSGPSGVGKSSLVRAGLLPRLARPYLFPGIAACRWCLIDCAARPTDGFLPALAQALLRPEVLGTSLRGFGLDAAGLARLLANEPGVAADQLTAALDGSRAAAGEAADAGAVQLALVVDPLDAVLADGDSGDADARAFGTALGVLAARDRVWVVATLRGDFVTRLASFPELAAAIDAQGHLSLQPPPTARIRQVVEIPSRLAGLELETPREGAGHGLIEHIEGEAALLEHWPPLLEATLQAMLEHGRTESAPEASNRRLSLAAYREVGGLLGVALSRADDAWQALGPGPRAALPRVARALVTVEFGPSAGAAPRDGDLDTLMADPDARALVEALASARLATIWSAPDPAARRPCRHGERGMLDVLARIARETRDEWRSRLFPGRVSDTVVGVDTDTAPEAGEPTKTAALADLRALARLTHPALPERWAPLRDWLDQPNNRRELVLRAQLNRQARQWKRTDCNAEYLLGEAGFAAARAFAEAHPDELEPLEREMLARSHEHLLFQRRRNRAARVVGLALIVLLGVATGAFLWAWDASRTATLSLHRSLLTTAEQAIRDGNTPEAVRLALDAGAWLPQAATDTLSRALTNNRLIALAQAPGTAPETPLAPAFSSDGEQLVTLSVRDGARLWGLENNSFSPEAELADPGLGIHTVRIADAPDGRQILGISNAGTWRLPAAVGDPPDWQCAGMAQGPAALDPAGRYLALAHPASEGRTAVCVADLTRPGLPLWDQPLHRGEIRSLAFAPDGMSLITAAREGSARVMDTITGFERLELPTEGPLRRPINQARFDAAGERIALACADERVRVYAANGRLLAELGQIEDHGRPLRIHKTAVRDAVFSADGRFLVAGDDEGQVVRWELAHGNPEVLGQHGLSVEHVRLAARPDPRLGEPLVLTASLDKTARLWGLITGKAAAVFSHDAAVSDAAFTRDGRRVRTYSDLDGSARLWSVAPTDGLAYRLDQRDHVWHVDLARPPAGLDPDPMALLLAAGSFDGEVTVWRYDRAAPNAAPQAIWNLVGHRGRVRRVAFSPSARLLASAGYDGTARIWDMVTGGGCALEPERPDGAEPAELERVLFDANERWVLTTATDPVQPVRLWDPAACVELPLPAALEHGPSGVEAADLVALEGDETLVATGNAVGTLRIVRRSADGSWRRLCRLQPAWRALSDVAIAPDGRLAASASEDGRIGLTELGTTGCGAIRYLGEPGEPLYSVQFSPEGDALLSASLDGHARLWALDGRLIAELTGHKDRVYHAEFSPDGNWILTASRDGTLRIWRRPRPGSAQDSTPVSQSAYLTLSAELGGAAHAHFSPDGHTVAGAYWEDAAVLWRLWSEDEAPRPALVRIWGETRARLALIREAVRFRAENRLDDSLLSRGQP